MNGKRQKIYQKLILQIPDMDTINREFYETERMISQLEKNKADQTQIIQIEIEDDEEHEQSYDSVPE